MKAHYNITNDKLFAKFDDRLSPGEYASCRAAGFAWWPGSKQFVSKWSTQAEDWLIERGLTIEDDDTPDNVEERVERFSKYAENAEQSAASSEAYLESGRANTERRQKNASNAIEKNLSAAEHWQNRIAGSIRAALYKERPDVIARRIDGLQKDERKYIKELDRKQWSPPSHCYIDGAYNAWRNRKAELEAQLNADKLADNPWTSERKAEAIAELRQLREAIFDKEKLEAAWKEQSDWRQRWLDHVQKRLQYERALLEAAGGIVAGIGAAPLDKEKFQVGGAIKTRSDKWRIVTKVNKRTVEVFDTACRWKQFWKVDRTEITETATAEEVKNAELHSELWHAQNRYQESLKAVALVAKIEKDHAAELDAFCRARGWGSYSHLGRDDKAGIIHDWQRAKKEKAE